MIDLLTPVDPGRPPRPEHRRVQRSTVRSVGLGALIALAVMALAAAALVVLGLTVFLVGGSGQSIESSDTLAEPAQPITEPTVPITEPVSRPDVPAAGPSLPASTFAAFGAAWEANDWSTMTTLATADVVTVAQQWAVDGGFVDLSTESTAAVVDGCQPMAGGRLSCSFLYLPPEGTGLIFVATYAEATDGGLTMVDLRFEGDAG